MPGRGPAQGQHSARSVACSGPDPSAEELGKGVRLRYQCEEWGEAHEERLWLRNLVEGPRGVCPPWHELPTTAAEAG